MHGRPDDWQRARDTRSHERTAYPGAEPIPPTTAPLRAVIYARQSIGNDDGIERQVERGMAQIEARGWTYVRTYADNDVSASKPRGAGTAWQSLLHADDVDVVVAVNLDRLLRQQADLTALIDSGFLVTTLEGELDLASASGELQASILMSMARFEARRKGERHVRANEQRRAAGFPPGSRRAFGYTSVKQDTGLGVGMRRSVDGAEYPDFGHEPHPTEAAAVRQGFAALLAGTPLRSIARQWNEAGFRTTTKNYGDGLWSAGSVRAVLSNPKYAGLMAPKRDPKKNPAAVYLTLVDLPEGRWEPLVPVETWVAARDLLADPARRSSVGAPVKTLLSGSVARCGVCGAPVKSGASGGVKLYRCSAKPHMSRRQDYADEFVEHITVARLSQKDAASVLVRDDEADVDRLRAELRVAQHAEENVLNLVAAGLTSFEKATEALKDVRAQMAALDARMADAGRLDVLGEFVASAEAAGGEREARRQAVALLWENSTVDRRRAVIGSLFDIVMRSPGKGSRPPRDRAGRLAHVEASMVVTPR